MFGWAISGRKVDQISTFHIISNIFVPPYCLNDQIFFSINISALQVHTKVKSYNIFLNFSVRPSLPSVCLGCGFHQVKRQSS